MRTWGPPGGRYPTMRPGLGRKFLKASSALILHSIEWPCAHIEAGTVDTWCPRPLEQVSDPSLLQGFRPSFEPAETLNIYRIALNCQILSILNAA